MAQRRTWTLLGLAVAGGGLCVFFLGNLVHQLILPLSLLGAGACFAYPVLKRRKRPRAAGAPAENSLPLQVEKEVAAQVGNVEHEVLGAPYARIQRLEIESLIDEMLDRCIKLIAARLTINTVAVFFPTEDGGYKIRSFLSRSEHINKDAVIYPGVGVIGSFLKDGLKQLNLHDIVTDSMTLYYYNKDANIRSLMASPIVAGGGERGTIIVDSTEPRHFTDEDHAFLTAVAYLCGQAVYYAYLCNEHKLRYVRLSAMSTTEKYFFQKHEVEAVLDKMAEIIPFAIPCDRLTISLRSGDGGAVVRRARGPDADRLTGMTFALEDKTLAGLLYAKNMCFYRSFSPDHYEVRYRDDEPRTRDLASFLAFPIGVDDCKGGILLESRREDAFSDSHRALLSRLVTSAGLAIEKILVLEQARSLATHDGLTGLNNHRQFQKLLRDEITRASRYREPLTLVLCDIDHFKKVNDAHGHPFGDTVLKGVSACLRESIRDGVDIAARYGGEEFALILVKSDTASALDTVERIRANLGKIAFVTAQAENITVTMSFGVATFGRHASQIDALIQKADKALYRAKEGGRNRAEVF